MTRENQRVVRELRKALNKTCREIGKRRGRKTVSGPQYQVRDGFLYVLNIAPPTFFDRERAVKVNLRCKPLTVDEMYWDVFQMAEEAATQPLSFHAAGAVAARDRCAARLREAEG